MIDTKLRPLDEVMTRLIVPIPEYLIERRDDSTQAEFINTTTQKDLLDWACGHGRWRAEVTQVIPNIATSYSIRGDERSGIMLGLILRLYIQTEEGWIWQDGTGTELLSGTQVYGDAFTNAYAQALRRAAESFGQARELWRRDLHSTQIAAQEELREGGLPQGTKVVATGNPSGGERHQSGAYAPDSMARSMADLVTPKQLGLIRASAREMGIDPDEECVSVMRCKTEELSKRGASSFIDHLRSASRPARATA
jgi:hypothetical protein